MKPLKTLFLREFKSYFYSPIGAVYIAAFVFFSILLAMQIGQLLEFNEASLYSFFQFQPYLLLIFVPALSMRIWAEEFKSGTFELLLALGYSDFQLILAKFIGALSIIILAFVATFPLWIAVNFLGNVDNFVVWGGYKSAIMLGANYLIISMAVGLATKNQIIALVISILIGFLLLASTLPIIATTIDALLGAGFERILAQVSILNTFENMIRGQFTFAGILQFAFILAIGFLFNLLFLKQKRRGQL